MFFPELLTALVIAMVLAAVFALFFGRSAGPWGGVAWFFIIIFLGAWAIGSWTAPVGPVFWGVAWVPFFFGALAIALLLAALAEPRRRHRPHPATGVREQEEEMALDAFFWGFLILLLLAIFVGFWI